MKKLIYKVAFTGIVSDSSKKLIEQGFKNKGDENLTIDLFCLYSEFEIPVGATFNYFEKENLLIPLNPEAMLIAITQQLGEPFNAIPKGWKTISKFQLSKKDINIIKTQLPIIDNWFAGGDEFYLLKLDS